MKTTCLFLAFYLLPILSFAQDTEAFDFFFKIYWPVTLHENGQYLAYVEHGKVADLTASTGVVYAIYAGENVELNFPQGHVQIDKIEQEESPAVIAFNESADVAIIKNMKRGLVETAVLLPKKPFRSIFFHLVKNCIFLADVFEENDFYSLDKILLEDSYELEQKIIAELLTETKFVAEAMREQMTPPMITAGRFAGSDLFSAMENSTPADIMSFLRYMKLRPRKYQGITWKFSEIYATWIDSGAPATEGDLKDLLLDNLGDTTELERFTNGSTPAALASFSENWRKEAQQAIENEHFTQAEKLLEIALYAAGKSGYHEAVAWSYFGQGDFHDALNEDEKARLNFSESAEYFEKAGSEVGIIAARNNEGRALINMGKYELALAPLKEAEKLCSYFLENEKGELIASVYAQVQKNIGESYRGSGNNELALEALKYGLELVEGRKDELSVKRKAMIMMTLSEIYGETGKGRFKEKYETSAIEAWKEYEAVKSGH